MLIISVLFPLAVLALGRLGADLRAKAAKSAKTAKGNRADG